MRRVLGQRKRNNQSGNMLVFACVSMAIVALTILVAFSFAGLFFAHDRLQASADEIALSGARKLNEINRLGQMNDMIARARQLVYGTRQLEQQVPQNNPSLVKLADQLMHESRDSATMLDGERQALTTLATQEAEVEMHRKFNEIKGTYAMTLPWLKVEAPKVVAMSVGTVTEMQSNSHELTGFDDLVNKDKANRYLSYGKSSKFPMKKAPVNLYVAEHDLPITGTVDSDLHFRLSPLPAPVGDDMSPARVTLPSNFKNSANGFAPCATRVDLALNAGTGIGPSGQGTFKVVSTAISTGGELWQ